MILGIYGTNGMGRELREIALLINSKTPRWDQLIFIDDTKEPGELKGCRMLPFEAVKQEYTPDEIEIVIGMGEPAYKELVWERVKNAGYRLATIIHPDAEVVPSAQLGEGVVVRKGSIVSSDSIVGNNVIIQSYVVVGHDVVVGDHCQISSFTDIAGHCKVGNRVFIGLGSCVKEETSIGDDAVVSMGAVVMKDVGDAYIVMGNPARPFGKNTEKKVFK
jgi:sugar O-acyltransferase (sialic acid O-acetyltransferase NeuD family)